jgi:tRNA pseudouridine38-40 synthase
MTHTFLARLHYAGAGFVGWQRQAKGRTVQAEVERVLERLCGRRIVAHGAGRTDAGVHAVGLGVSFSAPAKWTPFALRKAMNALLAKDCWIESVQQMAPGFHARKSATGRRYRYVIGTDEGAESPFRRPYEWALGRPLEAAKLEAAAAQIRGRHDFRAFAAKGEPKPHWECDLRVARWEPRPGNEGMTFHVAADRFLHHMVRMLVGTMVDIALDRRPVTDMGMLLAARENQDTSPPAPPQGLYFVAADYPAESFADLDTPSS